MSCYSEEMVSIPKYQGHQDIPSKLGLVWSVTAESLTVLVMSLCCVYIWTCVECDSRISDSFGDVIVYISGLVWSVTAESLTVLVMSLCCVYIWTCVECDSRISDSFGDVIVLCIYLDSWSVFRRMRVCSDWPLVLVTVMPLLRRL